MIRPTNIQSTQKVSVFGYVLGESGPARIRKSPPKDENRALFTAPSKFTTIAFQKRFWSKYLKFNGFFPEKKKLHVGKPSAKNPTQLRMDSKIRPAAPAWPWQLFQRDTTLMATINPASFPTWEVENLEKNGMFTTNLNWRTLDFWTINVVCLVTQTRVDKIDV